MTSPKRRRRTEQGERLAVQGLFDDFTPRAVWLEYGARKRLLVEGVLHPCDYERLLLALVDELGLGVERHQLSDAQRSAQMRAEEKWGGQ